MSDAMAEQKEAEVAQQKTAETEAQENQQARLWMLNIAVDPVTWEVALMPNQNVTKQGQIDTMLELARKQMENNMMARIVAAVMTQVSTGAKKKPLFGK